MFCFHLTEVSGKHDFNRKVLRALPSQLGCPKTCWVPENFFRMVFQHVFGHRFSPNPLTLYFFLWIPTQSPDIVSSIVPWRKPHKFCLAHWFKSLPLKLYIVNISSSIVLWELTNWLQRSFSTAYKECIDEGQAKQPVATPCRSHIPEVNDPSAPQPVPGVIRISQKAMESRMRRVFAPNIEGKYEVSQEIVQLFKNKKGKKTLTQIFQSCGFDTDHGTKKKVSIDIPREDTKIT